MFSFLFQLCKQSFDYREDAFYQHVSALRSALAGLRHDAVAAAFEDPFRGQVSVRLIVGVGGDKKELNRTFSHFSPPHILLQLSPSMHRFALSSLPKFHPETDPT